MLVPGSLWEDRTLQSSHESTNGRLLALDEDGARTVQGATASMADVERRVAPYFERAEP